MGAISSRRRSVEGAPASSSPVWRSDGLRRLARRSLPAALIALAVVQLYLQVRGHHYGYDFRGGTWRAGRALLSGSSPFPPAEPAFLKAHSNSFITPPPLAVLGAPFSLLPYAVAIVAFNLICVTGLAAALWLLGVRRLDVYLVTIGSFPTVASLCLGQPDGLFALGAALAWRYRGNWRGSLAAAMIISAKLLAWPLVVWLLVTRRYAQALLTGAISAAILMASWALIGFQGLVAYPRLLAADTQVFGTRAHSILTALWRTGVPLHAATVLTVVLAVALAAVVALAGRWSDLGLFTAALTLGIFASPVIWQHYFMLLFVALAATQRARDPLVWVLLALLWLSPTESPGTLAQAWEIPMLGAALAVRIAILGGRPAPALA